MIPSVGQTLAHTHTLTQEDFNRFAKISGDDNPIHVDPEFAARTTFGKTVAHGMFLYSLICATLDVLLPGVEQISQDLMFPNPSFAGEEIAMTVRVIAADAATHTATIETFTTRPNGEIGCRGEMRVRWQL